MLNRPFAPNTEATIQITHSTDMDPDTCELKVSDESGNWIILNLTESEARRFVDELRSAADAMAHHKTLMEDGF